MDNTNLRDFVDKFEKLNPANQRYIIAAQQALSYAQMQTAAEEQADGMKYSAATDDKTA